MKVWQTASLYHLVHTAALLATPVTKHPNIVSSPCQFIPKFPLVSSLYFVNSVMGVDHNLSIIKSSFSCILL